MIAEESLCFLIILRLEDSKADKNSLLPYTPHSRLFAWYYIAKLFTQIRHLNSNKYQQYLILIEDENKSFMIKRICYGMN